MTKHRRLIFELIMSSKNHMTAEEIYFKAKQTQSSIAIGTIYRNLGLMAETGEIRRICIPNGSDRFDKTTHPHGHLICIKCGQLSDVFISDLKECLEKHTGIKIIGYDLNIRYICSKCEKEEVK